jgi:histidinol dehydrogenase
VTDNLDNILISTNSDDFKQRIEKFYVKQITAARFSISENKKEWETVLEIVRDVSENGDKAVAKYTNDIDEVALSPAEFLITPDELKKAHYNLDKELLSSIRKAIENVRKYQTDIFIGSKSQSGIRYTPINSVGICVPGASAPLPSTVIMCAVPAQVAGVKKIVVVSPPRHNGSIHPVILGICYELGIEDVYRVGGAQAVAALASDKGVIPRVEKIVGPGNKWVQTAKKMVGLDYVGIESIAGPSEVLIIADANAKAEWVAADMLSQAEHGLDSTAIVVTDSETLARAVLKQLKKQLKEHSRAEQATKSLEQSGLIVIAAGVNEAVDFANGFAAEHLQIQCGDKSREVASKITNAGAIFIGDYTPVAVGDYWAGPSHTLPTGRTAKFASALTSNDFIKSISIIEYDKNKLTQSADDIIRLAQAEGLDAHARSVQIRMQ